MPKRKHLIELLAALRLLQRDEIPTRNAGICHNLSFDMMLTASIWKPIMDGALEHCGWYTGEMDFPIPCPVRGDSFNSASVAYFECPDKWDLDDTRTHSYAKRRFELVDRMIDVCIKHIDSPSSKLSVLK